MNKKWKIKKIRRDVEFGPTEVWVLISPYNDYPVAFAHDFKHAQKNFPSVAKLFITSHEVA